jgi:hypothetical protein
LDQSENNERNRLRRAVRQGRSLAALLPIVVVRLADGERGAPALSRIEGLNDRRPK